MTAKQKPPTWGCAGCRRRWTGVERAHCTACHQLFSTAGLFDRHRVGGQCANPADLRLVGGVWCGRPPSPAARRRFAARRPNRKET